MPQAKNVFHERLGSTIRQIRKNKGISQKQTCSDKFTQPTLTNIEAGKTHTSYENCVHIANQINVSLDELNYITNDYHETPINQILYLMRGFNDGFDEQRFKKIQRLTSHYYKETGNKAFKQLHTLSEAWRVYNISHDPFAPRALLEEIWVDLQKMDKWYYFELRLLTSVFTILPYKTALKIGERAIKDLNAYDELYETAEIQIKFILNIALLANINNEPDVALSWCDRVLDFSINNEQSKFLHGVYYHLFLSHIQKGNQQTGLCFLNRAIILALLYGKENIIEAWRDQSKLILDFSMEDFENIVAACRKMLAP